MPENNKPDAVVSPAVQGLTENDLRFLADQLSRLMQPDTGTSRNMQAPTTPPQATPELVQGLAPELHRAHHLKSGHTAYQDALRLPIRW